MALILDDNLIDELEYLDGYSVAVHGIDLSRFSSSDVSKKEAATQVISTGIRLGNSYKSINGNATPIGVIGENNASISRELSSYLWGKTGQTNVIVAYPTFIQNQSGEKIFLGRTVKPQGYDQDTTTSIMDVVCSKLGYIPKEFLFGYYIDKDNAYGNINAGEHITYDYEKNPYFNDSIVVSDELFDSINNSLDIVSKQISDVANECLEQNDISPFDNYLEGIRNLCQKSPLYESFYKNWETLITNTYKEVSSTIKNKVNLETYKSTK